MSPAVLQPVDVPCACRNKRGQNKRACAADAGPFTCHVPHTRVIITQTVTLSASHPCRDRELRADELVLLTRDAPPAAVKTALKTPPVHVIALMERSERGGGRTELVAAVNMLSGRAN